VVELEGELSEEQDFDADEGPLLIRPRRIADVRSLNWEFLAVRRRGPIVQSSIAIALTSPRPWRRLHLRLNEVADQRLAVGSNSRCAHAAYSCPMGPRRAQSPRTDPLEG
jgi:hypothetical protein